MTKKWLIKKINVLIISTINKNAFKLSNFLNKKVTYINQEIGDI